MDWLCMYAFSLSPSTDIGVVAVQSLFSAADRLGEWCATDNYTDKWQVRYWSLVLAMSA